MPPGCSFVKAFGFPAMFPYPAEGTAFTSISAASA